MSHPPVILPVIGQSFTVLPTVDSTNNYAMGQVRAGLAGHGAAYFALEQTAGRGQRGKTWITNPGENIMLSVVIQPHGLQISQQFLLSAAVALGCYDFFKNHAGEETRIKWPNDLYWRDRKAGGILIENRVETTGSGQFAVGSSQWTTGDNDPTADCQLPTANWLWAIVGIGININQTSFADEVKNPVSLKQIAGKEMAVEEMVMQLCACLEIRWQSVIRGNNNEIFTAYHQVMYKLNEQVKLKQGSRVFETKVCGVNAGGQLLTKDVIERQFDVGEVEWVF